MVGTVNISPIANLSASAHYRRHGLLSKRAGKEKSRIALITGDDRFNVYAVSSEDLLAQGLNRSRFVSLRGRMVNIGSLSGRLHISRKKVNEAANEGRLEALVTQRLQLISELKTGFERGPSTRAGQDTISALRRIKNSRRIFTKGRLFKSAGQHYLLRRKENGGLRMFWIQDTAGTELGSGAYGSVRRIRDLVSNQPFACKISADVDSLFFTRHEWRMLSRAHQDEAVDGVLGRALAIDKKGRYLITELYEHNGEAYLAATRRNCSAQFSVNHRAVTQILRGLQGLHKKGMAHRDLKPANLLGKGQLLDKEWVIADMGSATARGERPEGNQFAYSQAYTLRSDIRALHRARKNSDRYFELCQKLDVFSMAATMGEMLTGVMPYRHIDGQKILDANNRPQIFPMFRTQIKKLFPNNHGEVIKFFEECFDVDPDARPTVAQMVTRYDTLYADRNPPTTAQTVARVFRGKSQSSKKKTGVFTRVRNFILGG